MASTSTKWYPYTRSERVRRCWLLDNGTVMDEPELEQSQSRRRVRLAALPDVSDWMKDVDKFLGRAATAAAQAQGRKVWLSLGKPDENTLDKDRQSKIVTTSLDGKLTPYFIDTDASAWEKETRAAWRFRHATLPIEAQIEVTIEKQGYRDSNWTVQTKLIYPGTWPGNCDKPVYFSTTKQEWDKFIDGGDIYGTLNTRLNEWAHANPIDWCEGFKFGSQRFDEERAAVNAFAKIVRAIADLDEIEIPNLIHVGDDGEHVETIEMLSLRFYRTNTSQDLLDTLSDFLTGQPVVEQIKEKWLELSTLFRRVGMVISDPTDTEWWNFVVHGAGANPLEVTLEPVEDEDGTTQNHMVKHSVAINLATGTIVVACSKSHTKDETAIQWETSLIKAEMTGQKDRFLAYADAYIGERQNAQAQEMMENALDRARPNYVKPDDE